MCLRSKPGRRNLKTYQVEVEGTILTRKTERTYTHVLDGVVHDTWKPGPRCIITDAWCFLRK